MPNNWKTYKLGEITAYQKGFAFKSDWYKDKGDLVVRVSDTTQNSIDISTCQRIDKEKSNELQKYKLEKDDIVIATVGSWPPNFASVVGKVVKVPVEADGALLNQNAVRLKSIDDTLHSKKYIYYLMKSEYFLRYIVNTAQGSANQASIKLTDIFDFKFDIPQFKEQQSIASILSDIDDKIENNLAINKTLEEMAMALYKNWFVDFGPFKDGEFVESELGSIPMGWEVKRLNEIAFKRAETYKFKGKEKVVFVNTGDVLEGSFMHKNYMDIEDLPGQAKKAIYPEDILYSEIRPGNKRYAYVDFDSQDYVVSTKFMVIRNNELINNKLLYRILTRDETITEFQNIAESRSGTFPQITFDAIGHIQFALPNIDKQNEFQSIVGNWEEQQANNLKENQALTQLRNTLLPKLISGEVRLKEYVSSDK